MATETEILIEQLKELVESFKNIDTYAKNLAAAIASSNQPMQRSNDMAKAIQEHMERMAKDTKDTVESTKKMNEHVADSITKMREAAQLAGVSKDHISQANKELIEQKTATEEVRTKMAQLKLEQYEANFKNQADLKATAAAAK